jgi:hypothetical protein
MVLEDEAELRWLSRLGLEKLTDRPPGGEPESGSGRDRGGEEARAEVEVLGCQEERPNHHCGVLAPSRSQKAIEERMSLQVVPTREVAVRLGAWGEAIALEQRPVEPRMVGETGRRRSGGGRDQASDLSVGIETVRPRDRGCAPVAENRKGLVEQGVEEPPVVPALEEGETPGGGGVLISRVESHPSGGTTPEMAENEEGPPCLDSGGREDPSLVLPLISPPGSAEGAIEFLVPADFPANGKQESPVCGSPRIHAPDLDLGASGGHEGLPSAALASWPIKGYTRIFSCTSGSGSWVVGSFRVWSPLLPAESPLVQILASPHLSPWRAA